MVLGRHGLASIVRTRPCRSLCLSNLAIAHSSRSYATNSSDHRDIAIFGGGITGLASAYYLSKSLPDATITIYEAGPRIGGWLSSKQLEVDDGTVLFEAGPRTLRPHGNGVLAATLVHELNLQNETIFTYNSSPAAINRFLYYPDHMVQVPMPQLGLFNLVTTLLSEPAFKGILWQLSRELMIAPRDEDMQDESIGDFFSRRLSSNLVDRVMSAVIHGIYAGDVYQLSAKSLFPRQWRDELAEGSILGGMVKSTIEGPEMSKTELLFMESMKKLRRPEPELLRKFSRTNVFTFRRGLSQLVEALADHLRLKKNVHFLTNTGVESVSLQPDNKVSVHVRSTGSLQTHQEAENPTTESIHNYAISTLAPAHLSKITSNRSLSSSLDAIPAVTVMTVVMYFRTPNLHPDGFGYLIPLATPFDQNPERALGVVFDTSYSPPPNSEGVQGMEGPAQDDVHTRGTKLTVMLGGHYWADWPVYPSEEEGLEMARAVVRRHLGITEEPAAHLVTLQKDCIPQYTVGHEQRLTNIRAQLLKQYKGKLRVAGNWARGVGVNDCLRSAWDVVQAIEIANRTGLEEVVIKDTMVRLKP